MENLGITQVSITKATKNFKKNCFNFIIKIICVIVKLSDRSFEMIRE